MSKHEDFSKSLLRHIDNLGEYFTVKATGQSGMSHRGLARFIDKHHTTIMRWAEKVRNADPLKNDLPQPLKSFSGKNLTLGQYEDSQGRDILEDTFCAALTEYFAWWAPDADENHAAKNALGFIRDIGIRQFIHLKTGWSPVTSSVDFESEFTRHKQRLNTRIALKDVFRVELMDAIRDWRKAHKASRKVFSEAQDVVNKRLQGLKSRQIKDRNGLAKSALIRDYFDAEPLIDYSAINRLAANLIITKDMHPAKAVSIACDMYIKPGYTPAPVPLLENVHKADKRLAAEKRKRDISAQTNKRRKTSIDQRQLSLFELLPPPS